MHHQRLQPHAHMFPNACILAVIKIYCERGPKRGNPQCDVKVIRIHWEKGPLEEV
jgi:hypothetical protein